MSATEETGPDLAAIPWRTGRQVGRTIYAQAGDEASLSDVLIGMMDTPELAGEACAAHNYRLAMGRIPVHPVD